MDETRPRGRPREAALDERMLDATLRLMAEVGYAHELRNELRKSSEHAKKCASLQKEENKHSFSKEDL
jgi:hypothetical protein